MSRCYHLQGNPLKVYVRFREGDPSFNRVVTGSIIYRGLNNQGFFHVCHSSDGKRRFELIELWNPYQLNSIDIIDPTDFSHVCYPGDL